MIECKMMALQSRVTKMNVVIASEKIHFLHIFQMSTTGKPLNFINQ